MKNLKIWQLVLGLLIVIGGTTLFILAVSGVFGDKKVELSSEHLGEVADNGYIVVDKTKYEELAESDKTFLIFVDQGGCTTADRLEGFVSDYTTEKGVAPYLIEFSEMKETSLHEKVKYYPSVVIVSNGKVIGYLKADSDEDADAYNDYEAFLEWMNRYLK